MIPAGFTKSILERSATGKQLDNENDQRNDQQQMNESTGDMNTEAEQPKNE